MRHAIIRDKRPDPLGPRRPAFQCVTRVLLFGIGPKIPPLQWASPHLAKGLGSADEDSAAHGASSFGTRLPITQLQMVNDRLLEHWTRQQAVQAQVRAAWGPKPELGHALHAYLQVVRKRTNLRVVAD